MCGFTQHLLNLSRLYELPSPLLDSLLEEAARIRWLLETYI